jgi:hypothetical protein
MKDGEDDQEYDNGKDERKIRCEVTVQDEFVLA